MEKPEHHSLPSPKPTTPRSVPESSTNPYPTTFVQADTSSFKQVVQMLTGSTDTAASASSPPAAPKNPIPPKKPAFKLYERRNSLKNLNSISPLIPTFLHPNNITTTSSAFSPRKQPEILSPSILDFPSLTLSPVTPLISDPFNRSPDAAMSAEEKAIAEKGFYLHPSPRGSGDKDVEPPRLLPLFPVTSPRVSTGQ